ncbi:MBL fold metallo-hydrolase [Methylobacterium sp. CB376]|uniref:MBL fold metallo-hydrolase n=2 Tax=Methylobacterium TaxID=407 RepID=UPI0012374321|nr:MULTISPECIES: MBL fold metallo-hydrolase [Methylobacterium]WFT82488.1 MBL fold metallo-hydrolase [Methylobacterium nodulans]
MKHMGLLASDSLTLRFWGVRGSVCASGPNVVEFGGHTPCVEIRCGERLFVIDAGTGINALGAYHGADLPQRIDLLFSHLHLDHVTGLAFFKPAVLDRTREIHTYCGNLDGESAEAPLNRLFSPPLFPITLDALPARFVHHGFRAGETLTFADGSTVATLPLQHPQGATGYRFRHAGRTACYISDIEHSEPWPERNLLNFVRDADLVVYDGMFTEGEYPACRGWGHSTWEKGVELCRAANVGRLGIIHLYPQHSDAELRDMEKALQAAMPTAFIARERQKLVLAAETCVPEFV